MMPNSDLKVLGEKVRTERKLAGLTQEPVSYTHLREREGPYVLSAPKFVSDWIVNPAVGSVQRSPVFIYFKWLVRYG